MTALLAEVAEVLARHGRLRCVPTVSTSEGEGLVLTVTCAPEAQDGIKPAMEAFELYNALAYLQDVASLRALAAKYDIDPAALERLLPKGAAG